jgi:hypothetical protein
VARVLFHCTHGRDDPERAIVPFIAANVAAASGQDVLVVLTMEGAWLGRDRRLSEDYEFLTATSEAVICLAMTRPLLRRLTRPGALQTPSTRRRHRGGGGRGRGPGRLG